jgi:CubicO group peptidase (beta-lactamase class C family)
MSKSMTCILILLFLTASTQFASAESPEAIEEGRAVGLVKLVQAGDAEGLLAYMQENWTPPEPGDDRDAKWGRIAKMLTDRHSGLEIVGALTEQEHQLTIVTQDADGSILRFIFEFEIESPYRIAGMGLEAGEHERGPDLPPIEIAEGSDREQITSALNSWFEHLTAQGVFSGTALVAWYGETVFSDAWGLASIEWNVRNNVGTRFDLGSINKSFTKIAVGQLMVQGRLSLDDKISDHLPDYPNSEVAHKVTIRHLIEHSSGLGDIFIEEFFHSSKALYRGPRDFFPLFANEPLRFEPGERSEYSNAGFMVLGTIIESVSGMPYEEYVRRHIFEPAGMENTGFFAHDEPVPNVAVGYTRMRQDGETGDLHNNLFHLPIKGNSAGSAQSTVEDLLRFDNAIREHQLLPPAYTAWYFNGGDPNEESSLTTDDRITYGIGIAGGAPGVSAVVESDGDIAVIVLSNFDSPIAETVARTIYRPLKQALDNMD